VWGTFSVKDHLREDAFVSEVLIYDRLVLPVPVDDNERSRWRRPNPNDPAETWDPSRLDELLAILGTQRRPRRDGGKLAWEVDWSHDKWTYERSRLEMAGVISDDAFWATRRILAQDDAVPGVVDAVAAYPSGAACARDRDLREVNASAAANAAIGAVIARPLLVPNRGLGAGFEPLKEAVDLAIDEDFKTARRAYYEWVREFFAPLQTADGSRPIDPASLALARERLNELRNKEREVVMRHHQAHRWHQVGEVFTVIGLAAGWAGALQAGAQPADVVGASAGILAWVTGRLAPPPPDRPPLTGASMFEAADQRLGWLTG